MANQIEYLYYYIQTIISYYLSLLVYKCFMLLKLSPYTQIII